MKRTPTTSVSKLLALFTLLERKGVDVKAFLTESGIAPDIAAYPDRRIPLPTVIDLNRKASDLIGDDFIGLHQGEVFTGFSNILGYVLMNCRDIAEAIEKYAKYQQILDEGRILVYHISDDQVLLQYRIADPYPQDDRHLTEHLMMGMLTYSRILTGIDIPCREVHFIHKAPRDTSEYERLFKCLPQFGSRMNAFVFDKAYLNLPILQPNRELLVVLEGYAREVLNRLQANDSYANKVRRVIVDVLRGESPTIKMIASRVNMSVRNLQMKLKEEGTTYSTLLAEGRMELARAYLKDRDVPIEEIAYLLGFSEPSVFHRTFKRWTGTTPGLFRRQVVDANCT